MKRRPLRPADIAALDQMNAGATDALRQELQRVRRVRSLCPDNPIGIIVLDLVTRPGLDFDGLAALAATALHHLAGPDDGDGDSGGGFPPSVG